MRTAIIVLGLAITAFMVVFALTNTTRVPIPVPVHCTPVLSDVPSPQPQKSSGVVYSWM